MNEATAFGFDVFLRNTNPNGSSYVSQHRAWDKDAFVASKQKAAAKVNADQNEGEPRKAAVQQITEDQYHSERKA